MSFCMLASGLETDLLSRNTQPLPLSHPPNHLPAPPLQAAAGNPCNQMSTQGRPRQQRWKPRASTDAAGNRKRWLCAQLADRTKREKKN